MNRPGADRENLFATYLKAWLVQGMPVYTKYPMHFFASLLRKLVEFQKSLESDLSTRVMINLLQKKTNEGVPIVYAAAAHGRVNVLQSFLLMRQKM